MGCFRGNIMDVNKPPSLAKIMDDVDSELRHALTKFPTWPTDPIHAAQVVAEEAGELGKAALQACYEPDKATRQDMYDEAVQTAATALRFLMSIHTYAINPGQQHQQTELFRSLAAPREK